MSNYSPASGLKHHLDISFSIFEICDWPAGAESRGIPAKLSVVVGHLWKRYKDDRVFRLFLKDMFTLFVTATRPMIQHKISL